MSTNLLIESPDTGFVVCWAWGHKRKKTSNLFLDTASAAPFSTPDTCTAVSARLNLASRKNRHHSICAIAGSLQYPPLNAATTD